MKKGLLLAELLGTFGSFVDGAHDCGTKCALFEGPEPGDGSSTRRRDAIAKLGGMNACFGNHGGSAENGLGGELQSLFFWNAFEEGSVGEGLDERVDVGRAASGGSGNGVEESLFDLAGRAY